MSRLSRITQLIFASSASNNGVFGSAQDGTKVLTNNLATLQSKPAYLTGWLNAVMGASKFPPLEEFQALEYISTSQLAYLFQEGVSEYDVATTYYTNSWVKKTGTNQLYVSLTNGNVGNALTDPTNWQLLFDFSSPPTGFSTGDTKETYKTTADSGWVMANDGTIGDASSGATTRANADTAALFTLFWTNCSNTACPVSGGRGGSAAADFAAHKTLNLPLNLGRAKVGAGSGSGLTARALGAVVGEETHTMSSGELVSHTHTASVTDPTHHHSVYSSNLSASNNYAGLAVAAVTGVMGETAGGTNAFRNATGTGNQIIGDAATGISVSNSSTGSTTPFNVMQPSTFMNTMIKL